MHHINYYIRFYDFFRINYSRPNLLFRPGQTLFFREQSHPGGSITSVGLVLLPYAQEPIVKTFRPTRMNPFSCSLPASGPILKPPLPSDDLNVSSLHIVEKFARFRQERIAVSE
jgi:hypothetical protein